MTGLLVDAVSDIVALSDDELQPPPDMSGSMPTGVIKALTLLGDRMIRVLDLPNVVGQQKSEAA
jgi:purine-binding chemotaxis protein CheW